MGGDFPTPERCLENPVFNDDKKLETKKLLLTAVWFSTGICGLSTTDEESKKKKKIDKKILMILIYQVRF